MNNFKLIWKALAREKKITRCDMALLCLVEALRKEEKDQAKIARLRLIKRFTPIKNQKKLDNGAHPYLSMYLGLLGTPTKYISQYEKASKELIACLTPEEQSRVELIAKSILGLFGNVKLFDANGEVLDEAI